jgi:hypothetical protein
MRFQTEKMLVDRFLGLLEGSRTPWGAVRVGCEFFYARGRTDVVALDEGDMLIAFEAKLKDWKTALHQAYRNTCFAHSSYVVLPKDAALGAMRFLGEFESRRVGLCYIDGADLVVLQESPFAPPLEPWLASEAISQLQDQQ